MLFSKLLFPLVALFGFATVAFATPIAEPAPVAELETRDAQAAGVSSVDRKSTRLNSSHSGESRMPSSA